MKSAIIRVIEDNRAIGGSSWRDYTSAELKEIYGYLPYWAERP